MFPPNSASPSPIVEPGICLCPYDYILKEMIKIVEANVDVQVQVFLVAKMVHCWRDRWI